MVKKYLLLFLIGMSLTPHAQSIQYPKSSWGQAALCALTSMAWYGYKTIGSSLSNSTRFKTACGVGLFSAGGFFMVKKTYQKLKRGFAKQQLQKNPCALHEACHLKDLDKVKDLVHVGADVNLRNDEGKTPLYYAAMYGNIRIAEYLIENGAEVNVSNDDQLIPTPLHAAVVLNSSNQLEVVRLLINNDAQVNVYAGSHNLTPLHTACLQRNAKAVRLLINAGADVNAKDVNNCTPLLIPVWRSGDLKYRSIALMLIKAGANLFDEIQEGITPFHYLSQWVSLKKITHLLAQPEKNQENREHKQYLVDEYGEKEIKSLKDICTIDILKKNNVADLAQLPIDLLCDTVTYLSFDQIKCIMNLRKNAGAIPSDIIKENTRDLFWQCCRNQLEKIQQKIPKPRRLAFFRPEAIEEHFRKITEAQCFADLPDDLQHAVQAKIMKALDLQPEDI